MPVPDDKSDFIEEWYKARDKPESANCEIRATLAVRINYKKCGGYLQVGIRMNY
jgi:hypothetical protein